MSRGSEANAIDDLKRSCKLVDVDAVYSAGGWRIRGRQNDLVVIDIRETYFKTAKKAFEEAYAKALQNGIVKPR
jgi:hypothetical protein